MSLVADVASWLLLSAGAAFVVIGSIGLLRLPDFYSRLHPAGLTDTLGAGLMLLGLAAQSGASLVTVKLIIIIVLLWLTSPTSTHATARAALAAGLQPHSKPPVARSGSKDEAR